MHNTLLEVVFTARTLIGVRCYFQVSQPNDNASQPLLIVAEVHVSQICEYSEI